MDRMTAGLRQSLPIERFLWGQFDAHGQADFLAHCDVKQLENESAFEALFYSMSWGLQSSASGLEKESEWAQLAVPMPVSMVGGSDTSPLFPESEWARLISRALDAVTLPERGEKFIRFPKLVRYLAAACFVGVVAAGIVWKQHYTAQRAAPRIVVIAHEKNVRGKPAQENPAGRQALAFDTLVIYSTPDRVRTAVSADRGEGIVRLGDKTAILLEKDAAVAVTAQNDTAVAVSVSRGCALFTVEKKRYRRFFVATPACDIAVTGTIFRLSVEYDTTIVSVLEGSVQAHKKAGAEIVAINAGMSAHIRPDTVMVDYGDTAATLLYRSSLLHDYLTENGVWENGRFVRSGMPSNADTLP
jgi:hypothetical protein